jgi:superfamily II DNA or RNA helicase
MIPRDFQSQAVDAVEHGWIEHHRQLIVAPTGSGKTIMFAFIAAKQTGRTLILAHREELIDQAIDKLKLAAGITAEKEMAEHHAGLDAPCVVASVQSMIRRLDKWPRDHFALVVADEAHHAISDSWQRVLKHFEPARVLGVTATPDRGDMRNLGEYFQAVAAEISMLDLIRAGHLSQIVVRTVPLEIDLRGVKSVAGDFQADELGERLDGYLGRIAEEIIKLGSFRRILTFLPLIKTSKRFAEILNSAGLRAGHVDGEMRFEDRAYTMQRFREFDLDVLCNAMLLTEGYDDPGIDCVVPLRPTRSRSLFAQMCGRGTRNAPCKENLLLLDFLWLHDKHALSRPAHLVAHSDAEADVITRIAAETAAGGGSDDQLEIESLLDASEHEREANLRKQLSEVGKKKSKVLSAEEWCAMHGAVDAATFQPVFAWEEKPITDKQAKYLKRAKIDAATVRGRGHATKLLAAIFKDRELKLASPSQLKIMRRMGHEAPPTTTDREAQQFFARLRTKS